MPTSQTPNYQLNQWSRDDRILMEDFNADNAKIDAAIAGHEGRVAALERCAPFWGNCRIYASDYIGTGEFGKDHPSTMTFPKKPVWITILNDTGQVQVNILPKDIDYEYSSATSNHKVSVKWNGSTLSWYGSSARVQMNALNASYYIIAFWPMD